MSHSIRQENALMYQGLSEEGALPGPISLSMDIAHPLRLPQLEWQNWHSIGQLKITNTGYTTVVTGHWQGRRPTLCGGPLTEPYALGQIHFHWGSNNNQGSEHTIDDKRFPLEMHVLFYKESYHQPKIALKERDGIIVLAYVFEVHEDANTRLDPILEGVHRVRKAGMQVPISPDSINIVKQFDGQYFLYWGAVITRRCSHALSWIVCPEPQSVSTSQLNLFRQTLGPDKNAIKRNYCDLQPHMGRSIFYCNTSKFEKGTQQKETAVGNGRKHSNVRRLQS